MAVWTVSLTRDVIADTEDEARERFEQNVINGGDWDADSIDAEIDEEETRRLALQNSRG